MIIDFEQIHREFKENLLKRKDPDSLWGSPFENALTGVVLSSHIPPYRFVINEIQLYLDKWIERGSFSHRDIVALSLYSVLLCNLGKDNKLVKVATILNENLHKLIEKKLDSKFSLFNSPELFYFTTLGIAVLEDKINSDILDKFKEFAKRESQERWRNKPNRFAYFAAAAIELNLDDLEQNIKRHINSFNIEDLRINEVISLLWFLVKYQKELEPKQDLITQILEQFVAQKVYFSYEEPSDEHCNIYYLSNLELALLDEAFNILKIGRPTRPNLLYKALQIHPRIRNASEELFKDGHYAQAILEACKELINFVKEKSGKKNLEGKDLMAKVFDFEYDKNKEKITKKPILQLNELITPSERDEQNGFRFLFMGVAVGIRNPKAHDRIIQKDPYRTLEYLIFVSLLAKRVEESKKINH